MTASLTLGTTAAATGSVTESRSGERRTTFLRRIFVDTPEDSLKLRMVTLSASLWAAFTIAFVGVPALIPLGAMLALAAGHFVSYRRRRAGIVWISLAIGIFIVTLGIVMRLELVAAVRGDRVPMAFFLLATGAASSFDMRTRAGLYTQLIFSGIVMFFAGELAFNNSFSLMLGVYAMIVVGFFATAFWEDEAREARRVRFTGPVAPVAFASTLSLVLIAASVGAFMLLPWNSSQTPPSQRTTFVPFSGDGAPPGVTPQQAREFAESGGPFGPQATTSVGEDGLVQITPETSQPDGSGPAPQGPPIGAPTDELAALARIGDPLDPSLGDADGLVMHVRSPVASYWRAAAFDTYSPTGIAGSVTLDGTGTESSSGGWYATFDDDLAYSSPFRRREEDPDGERYLQTFFLNSDVNGEILTGYDPLSILAPGDGGFRPVIQQGTTYQVVSRRPESSADALRNDRTEWQGPEYATLPQGFEEIASLTDRLTADAPTDFDRAAAIASYLSQLELDEQADNQLVSSAALDEFVFGNTPGTSVDFATAMTLMGRAAGLPTRLANGYLPGSYNPFSGANTVTETEAHAWTEIAFEESGWVPFDAAPRPGGTDAANDGGVSSNPLSSLLENRLGDRVASDVGGGIGDGVSGLFRLLTNGLLGFAIGAVWVAFGVIGWFAWRRWTVAGPGGAASLRYASISGEDRETVLDAFRRAEALAARSGFRVRKRTESFAEFAVAALSAGLPVGASLRGLASLAGRAAYSETPLERGVAATSLAHVSEIKLALATVDLRQTLVEAH